MSDWRISSSSECLTVEHPDGSVTALVRHPEWDAVVTLERETVRRLRDGRLWRRVGAKP